MRILLRAVFTALLGMILLSACECGRGQGKQDAGLTDAGPSDAGPTDAGPSDGGEGDAGVATLRPEGIHIAGGGGEASSADHRVRVSIGAPQPMGSTGGPGHTLEAGPETGP